MGFLTETLMSVIPQVRVLQEGPLPLTAARVVEWLSGEPSATGVRVSPEGALKLSAVWACVRLISEDVASLPFKVYRRLPEGGKEPAPDHPLYQLLHDSPNPYMTAMQFRETLQGHLLLRGNAYAEIERDGDGRILALWPLRPDRMMPPVASAGGTLLYTYRLPNGEDAKLTQSQVLHIRGLSSDGIMGYSPIAVHRDTIGWSMGLKEYGGRYFSNNANPGGVLMIDKRMSEEGHNRLKSDWDTVHQGLEKAHRVAILEEGVKWQSISNTPADSQFLESMKYGRVEIASIYRVPPHKINEMDRATFSNIEEQAIEYVNEALRTWLVRWEQQVNKDLFTELERKVHFVEHNMDALLRGRYLERQQGLQTQFQNGAISDDEWREIENRNPLPNGDGKIHLQPANLVPLGTVPQAPAPARTVRELRRLTDGTLQLTEGVSDGE